MTRYIVGRLLQIVPVIVGISIVVFLLVRLIPGDPATAMLGSRATAALIARVHDQFGLAVQSQNDLTMKGVSNSSMMFLMEMRNHLVSARLQSVWVTSIVRSSPIFHMNAYSSQNWPGSTGNNGKNRDLNRCMIRCDKQ